MKMIYIQVVWAFAIQFRLCFQTWCIFWRRKTSSPSVWIWIAVSVESWSCQLYCCTFAACSVLDWWRPHQRDWNGMDWSRCCLYQSTHWNWTKLTRRIAHVVYSSVDNLNEAPANPQIAHQYWCTNRTASTHAHRLERNNAPINAWKW